MSSNIIFMNNDGSIKKLSNHSFTLADDIKVFGVQVKTFPLGIGDAFAELTKSLVPADERRYYGISQCTKDGVVYIAAAEEAYKGEGKKYGYESFIVERGEYLTQTVFNWRAKTNSIRYVFEEMFRDERADGSKPCIELYKNEDEMMCMVKVDTRKELQKTLNCVTDELIQIVSSLDDEQLNQVPFTGSWTAGQVVEHVIRAASG